MKVEVKQDIYYTTDQVNVLVLKAGLQEIDERVYNTLKDNPNLEKSIADEEINKNTVESEIEKNTLDEMIENKDEVKDEEKKVNFPKTKSLKGNKKS